MGGGYWLNALRPGAGGRLERVKYYIADTRDIFEYAELLSGRVDQPGDMSVDCLEPMRIDGNTQKQDCHEPKAVLAALEWLKAMAGKDIPENARFRDKLVSLIVATSREKYRSQPLLTFLEWDLNGMLALAREADAEGLVLAVGWVA